MSAGADGRIDLERVCRRRRRRTGRERMLPREIERSGLLLRWPLVRGAPLLGMHHVIMDRGFVLEAGLEAHEIGVEEPQRLAEHAERRLDAVAPRRDID